DSLRSAEQSQRTPINSTSFIGINDGGSVSPTPLGRRRFLGLAAAAAAGTSLPALLRPAPALAGSGTFAESTVWASGEDSRATHHVYGFAVTTLDTVLAFSEARIDPYDTATP